MDSKDFLAKKLRNRNVLAFVVRDKLVIILDGWRVFRTTKDAIKFIESRV